MHRLLVRGSPPHVVQSAQPDRFALAIATPPAPHSIAMTVEPACRGARLRGRYDRRRGHGASPATRGIPARSLTS